MFQGRTSAAARLLALAALVCLAGCERPPDGEAANPAAPSEADHVIEAPGDALTTGHLGAVEYSFDSARLVRAEIQLGLPPDYERAVWAIKLIPIAHAQRLGEKSCHYGPSTEPETCTAENAEGLSMALLERPIEDYRETFLGAGTPESDLHAIEHAGAHGFSFAGGATSGRVEYIFLPVEERTLLLALHFSREEGSSDPALDEVLLNLKISA